MEAGRSTSPRIKSLRSLAPSDGFRTLLATFMLLLVFVGQVSIRSHSLACCLPQQRDSRLMYSLIWLALRTGLVNIWGRTKFLPQTALTSLRLQGTDRRTLWTRVKYRQYSTIRT